MDAVLLDLDGTLLDTAPDLAAAANGMLRELGLRPCGDEEIASFIGHGVGSLARRALAASTGSPASEAQLAAAMPVFERHYDRELGRRTRPYPGVEEGLADMRAQGLRLGCVTNKAGRFARAHLERAGLAHWLECVVAGDEVARPKPDPMPYRVGCERLGIAPAAVLAIGDSRSDVDSARGAGCTIWCVPYGYRQGEPVSALACDALVEDLRDAARRLAALGRMPKDTPPV
jgi:phosphoglycolate phosphatase